MNKCRQIYSWLQVAAMTLTLAALSIAAAEAGVEFVAPIGNCGSHVDAPGDGKNLFILAGQDVRFEVFGNSIDLFTTTLRLGSGSGTVSARIIKQRGGAENFARGCGNTGSAEVEVDSDVNQTSNVSRALFFKMPAGDESSLPMTIKALPAITATTWVFTDVGCIVKTGTIQKLNQDKKIKIQLPAGHRQDQTTCNQKTLSARVDPADIGELDIRGPLLFTYSVTGRPAFLSSSQTGGENNALAHPGLLFTFDVPGVRAITTTSNSNITITSANTNRTTVLNLEIVPEAGNGFTAVASCNPSTFVAGNLTDCSLTLATAPTGFSQPITWRMTTATCFTQAVATAPYDPNATFQVFNFPVGQTTAIIRVRSANNAGCTDRRADITHVFEAWIGDFRRNPQVTTVTSGPSYTKTTIKLQSPNQ